MSVKVLVVDDSAFMRKIISDILSSDPKISVIDTARNGKDALEKISALAPDVVTLDVEMPIMDGIKTLEEIIRLYNIPVIMLSSLTIAGAEATVKALELGAFDFITKPTSIFSMDNDIKKQELIDKVLTASKVKFKDKKIIRRPRIQSISQIRPNGKNNFSSNIVAIGTSTGGPRALQSIIPLLPQNVNASFLIVQHMPPGFTKSLADRLDSISHINVKEAENGEAINKGFCYIAPGDFHMTIKETLGKAFVSLNKSSPVSGHRPSVDMMMQSVSHLSSFSKVGIILTGMGSDGAMGISKIKSTDGYTIAQDEATSIVYGMPKSAINKEVIDIVLPLDEIASEIINKVGV